MNIPPIILARPVHPFMSTVSDLYPSEKVIALTFDDGPNARFTGQVLNILEQEEISATFFFIGKNVEAYPHVVSEVADNGHTIGNHSYSHPWLLPVRPRQEIIAEIVKTELAISQLTGTKPTLFRPPHGIMSRPMIDILYELGYKVVIWDTMTIDFFSKAPSRLVIQDILSNIANGSIIVLHDGLNLNHDADRTNIIRALPFLIRKLKSEGYKFVQL